MIYAFSGEIVEAIDCVVKILSEIIGETYITNGVTELSEALVYCFGESLKVGCFDHVVELFVRERYRWAKRNVEWGISYDLIPNHEEQGVGKIARSSAVVKMYLTAIMVGSFFVYDPSTGPVHLNHAVSERHP
tara:strand:- start:473 stop:871 length:399 start_codon:yes stop_codon:yes gene_type:complete